MRFNYLKASRYFIAALLGLNLFFGNAYSATTCCNPIKDPVVLERDNFSTPPETKQYYLPWIRDRIAGKPLANACPQS